MTTTVLLALMLTQHGADWTTLKATVRGEPPPKEITRGLHYVVSDEKRHDLFRADIADRGGIFVGVGTNQNFTMAAWAKPEYLVIVDFDQVVVDLLDLYRLAFADAATPAEFLDRWSRKKDARLHMLGLMDARLTDPKLLRRAKSTFASYRASVRWGLEQVMARNKALGVATYLEDAEQYAVLRKLFVEDRVLFVRADFTGNTTLVDLARVATELKSPVRVLYLSNIEQYFPWTQGHYRANMLALPFDERSVILRAYGFGRYATADGNYRYFVQDAANFRAWLNDPMAKTVVPMVKAGTPTEIKGFYRLTLEPAAAREVLARRRPRPPSANAPQASKAM